MEKCALKCWYLYPTVKDVTSKSAYRCHCVSSCAAFCPNCKHKCKKGVNGWCEKFELNVIPVQSFESPDLHPYADGECQHRHRVPYQGTEKCTGCGSVYDEQLTEWRSEDAE